LQCLFFLSAPEYCHTGFGSHQKFALIHVRQLADRHLILLQSFVKPSAARITLQPRQISRPAKQAVPCIWRR